MRISVAIITRNRQNLLKTCLASLTKQKVSPFEVLVIDNASSDQTKKIVLAFRNDLPLRYFYEAKIGIPYARNRALKEAKGAILAFIDDDCEAAPEWTAEMLRAHKLYPKAAAIQGKSKALPRGGIFSVLSGIYHQRWININKSPENELFIIDTKNVSFKRSALAKISFDESLERGSDIDIARQLLTDKKKILYYDKAIVHFWARPTITSFLKQRFLIGKAHTRLRIKWGVLPGPRGQNRNHILKDILNSILKENFYKLPIIFLLYLLEKPIIKLGRSFEASLFFRHSFGRLENSGLSKQRLSESPNRKNSFSTISIMVITKDHYSALEHCLVSLSQQTIKPHQVIIVDSSSSKETAFLSHFKQILPITYVPMVRAGYSIQRNIALKKVKNDIVAAISDDCQATRNWCENILKAHNFFPKATAIQGRIISQPQNSLTAIVEQVSMDEWFLRKVDLEDNLNLISNKNASYKMKLLKTQHLQFIDSHLYDKYGGEDMDMAYKIISRGGIIKYSPEIRIYHYPAFWEYLKHQYRSGKAKTLLRRDWPVFENNRNTSFPFSFYKRYFINLIAHPLLGSNILRALLFLPAYYLSKLAYTKGIRDLENDFLTQEMPQVFIKKSRPQANSLSVAIITRNRDNFLTQALSSLTNQTLLPSEIIVVDNGSIDNTKDVVSYFKKNLPIRYFYEAKIGIPFARNRALKEARGEILAFLDDDCEASPDWVKNMLEAHQKYPETTAIQGRSESLPKNGIFSIITRFNRQTSIRDSMQGNRDLYWDWVAGGLQKDFTILTLDTKNVSLKLNYIRRFGLKFNESMKRGSDSDFGKQLLSEGKHIIFYPPALSFHWERGSLTDFLKQSYYQGKTAKYIGVQWPAEYSFKPIQKNWLRNTAAFAYYCLKRKYFLKFPLLLGVFLLYQISFDQGRESYMQNAFYKD